MAESEADRAARQQAAEVAPLQPHNRDRSQNQAIKPEVEVPQERQFTAAPIYVNTVPMSDGLIKDRDTSEQSASYSLYQIRVDANNPNKAILLPAPNADPQLLNGYHQVMRPAYDLTGAPKAGDAYVAVVNPS